MTNARLPVSFASSDLKLSRPTRTAQRTALRAAALVFAVCAVASATMSAQTFTTLLTFDGTDGSSQIAPMVQGTDGNLYGTTESGGTIGEGTAFKITPEGALTTLYDFCNFPGCGPSSPQAALVQGTDGNFYGTTLLGGNSPACNGTVFKLTPQGTLTTLYGFCSQSSGQLPEARLVQAQDGNFYGTTYDGGPGNTGTVFRITPAGQLTTIHYFCSETGCADGAYPAGPGMVLGADGNLYGTTGQGIGYGTVFKITLSGQLTTLYTFCSQTNCADGRIPGPLAQGIDGTIYGTTYGGGLEGGCQTGCGTVFEITPAGAFQTLHEFCQKFSEFYCTDGSNPVSLTLGSDGNFYGTTQYGGVPLNNGGPAGGVIFRITPNGTFTTLRTFCTQEKCPDGSYPSNLVQSTSGVFYGVTQASPSTIFSANDGLPPFVQPLPRFGKVGVTVVVLGNNLSSTTSVSFDGTPAAFTVVSNHKIRATVPTGATTGQISVVTAHGILASNIVFTVVP